MEKETSTRIRVNGRFVKKKVHLHRLKRVEMGRACGKKNKKNLAENIIRNNEVIQGNRIVNITYMANKMKCDFCKDSLLMEDIESESRVGLGSIFSVRCAKCLALTKVPSSEQHTSLSSKYSRFDVNSRVALAAVHSGMGHTQVNKLFTTLNVPRLSNSYKRHEREVGPLIEAIAKESCEDAAKEERALTIEKATELQKLLPENLQKDYLIPDKEDSSEVLDTDLVRIFVSFDMGWSKRGTGRQYDSLNGFAAIIGYLSGRCLDFIEFNRKCKACDNGNSKKNHDCRKNYEGTAKGMEAVAAVELVVKSDILKKVNVQVGVFIGDNDSSSICSVRQFVDYPIVKYSDINHTKKGVTHLLYEVHKKNDPENELSSDAIKYLQMCFGYAVKKNKGNISQVQADLKNIPFHAFNQHDNCGDWCGYKKNPDNYIITPGRFNSTVLFEELRSIFEKLSQNAEKFAAAASSQGNESLNSIMSKKAPKAICYSTSESSDFRFASTICQKNLGDFYLLTVLERLRIDPGIYLQKEAKRQVSLLIKKAEKAKTPQFKKNRRLLQKKRTELKNKTEKSEPILYKSNMTLLDMCSSVSDKEKENTENINFMNKNIEQFTMDESSSNNICIVFFDLETSDLSSNCDILQIALKHNDSAVSIYINPSRPISNKASEVHGLTEHQRQLLLHGKTVPSVPLRIAMDQVLQFLIKLNKPCLLVAHNCFSFDAPRLIRNIYRVNLLEEFCKVVTGFVDTLPLFKKKFGNRKGKNSFKLTTLAHETLSLSVEGAHNANYDVMLLEKVTQHHFTTKEIIDSKITFIDAFKKFQNTQQRKTILATLKPLQNIISKGVIDRLANAGISYESLVNTYSQKSEKEAVRLVQQSKNGKPTLLKQKKVVTKIMTHLKDITNVI